MSDFWMFGYGSLMWRPDFAFEESAVALLRGAHRSLCIYSWHYRGTRERPGLVLGLDRGGSCRGVAFRVAAANREPVLKALRERELITHVYREVWRKLILVTSGGEVEAVAFIVDRTSPQYAGALSREALLAHVADSRGQLGRNDAYVVSTLRHMTALGIRDATLEWLAAELALRDAG